MATVVVQLEGHGTCPGLGEKQTSYAAPIPDATSGSMHQGHARTTSASPDPERGAAAPAARTYATQYPASEGGL
jgi:hypothetical protein